MAGQNLLSQTVPLVDNKMLMTRAWYILLQSLFRSRDAETQQLREQIAVLEARIATLENP